MVKRRRRCSRPPGQPHSGCNYTSKYGDFVIFENVIVMCEGRYIRIKNTCSNLLTLLLIRLINNLRHYHPPSH